MGDFPTLLNFTSYSKLLYNGIEVGGRVQKHADVKKQDSFSGNHSLRNKDSGFEPEVTDKLSFTLLEVSGDALARGGIVHYD
jgi:hypothetical protein